MAEYIDRGALLKHLDERLKFLQKEYGALDDYAEGFEEAVDKVEYFDDADVVKVRHAEWVSVNESDNLWMCDGDDGCGGEFILLEGTPLANSMIFCPFCGADMRGGVNDNVD